jgi:acetyl esterase/lipase
MGYDFDPELAPMVELLPAEALTLDRIAEARTDLERLVGALSTDVDATGVVVTDREIDGPDGAPAVPVRLYVPEGEATAARSAYLTIHGGGFVMGTIAMEHAFAVQVARELGVVVAAVEYRLAPEHPYPAGLEDCYAALRWLHDQADELGVDRGRIGVGGQSAGGGLTAGLALLAMDRGGPTICFQLLGIPELDDRLETPSMQRFVDTPLWTRPNAVVSWQAYVGDRAGGPDVPIYAAPARATVEQVRGLPPAYVTTMEFDPLRDEGIVYALRLLEAGVSVELHQFPGTFHGSALIPTADVSRRAAEELLVALRRGLRVDA